MTAWKFQKFDPLGETAKGESCDWKNGGSVFTFQKAAAAAGGERNYGLVFYCIRIEISCFIIGPHRFCSVFCQPLIFCPIALVNFFHQKKNKEILVKKKCIESNSNNNKTHSVRKSFPKHITSQPHWDQFDVKREKSFNGSMFSVGLILFYCHCSWNGNLNTQKRERKFASTSPQPTQFPFVFISTTQDIKTFIFSSRLAFAFIRLIIILSSPLEIMPLSSRQDFSCDF